MNQDLMIEEVINSFSNSIQDFSYDDYVFPSIKSCQFKDLANNKSLSGLNETDYFNFSKWFNNFAKCACINELTKNQVCNLLESYLEVVPRPTLSQIRKDNNVDSMLKIEITIIKSLFGNEIVGKSFIRIMDMIDSKINVKELIMNLPENINDWIKASIVFNKVCENEAYILNIKLLSRLPNDIIRNIKSQIMDTLNLKFKDLVRMIQEQIIEINKFNVRAEKKLTLEAVKKSYNTSKDGKPIKELKCYCCGEIGHVKNSCEFKDDRCENCRYKGHTKRVCKNLTLYKDDQKAGLSKFSEKCFYFFLSDDEARESLLRSMVKFGSILLERMKQKRIKNREKYQINKEKELENEEGINRSKIDVSAIIKDLEERLGVNAIMVPITVNEDEINDKLINNIIYQFKHNKNKLKMGYILINGKKEKILLDSGAEVCVMSKNKCQELGLEINDEVKEEELSSSRRKAKAQVNRPVFLINPENNRCSYDLFYVVDNEELDFLILSLEMMKILDYNLNDNPKSINNISKEEPVAKFKYFTDEKIEEVLKECDLEGIDNKEMIRKFFIDMERFWEKRPFYINDRLKAFIKVNGIPKRVNPRPLSRKHLDILLKKVDEMILKKVITRVEYSNWNSPIIIIPKKNDEYRITIDYRELNKKIQDDTYYIPHMKYLLRTFHSKKWFSKIDLKDGFWNISLDENSKQYTAFYVPHRGTFVFNVLPYGLKTSPTLFQRMMENIFIDLIKEEKVFIYIGSLIIATNDIIEHEKVLRRVFKLLDEYNLQINTKKCRFFKKSIIYLGQIIDERGIRPDPVKVKAILQLKSPTSKKTLRGLIGSINQFRDYIKNSSEYIEPLTNLLKNNVEFTWTEEHDKILKKIKELIVNITYLSYPDPEKDFILYTDASAKTIGAVLTQFDEKTGETRYLHYLSKKLDKNQVNWSTIEKELYAIVYACEKLDYYIKGSKVIVRTDCKGIVHKKESFRGKLYRWQDKLSEFKLEYQHITGEKNQIADLLSRNVTNEGRDEENDIYVLYTQSEVNNDELYHDIPSLDNIILHVKKEKDNLPKEVKWKEGYPVHYATNRIYIPLYFRENVLYWYHGSKFSGHARVNKTLSKIKKYFWWPNMCKDVEDYISKCLICKVMRDRKCIPNKNEKLSKTMALLDLISLDVIGPRNWKGKEYFIYVSIDHYSCFMMVKVLDHSPTSKDAIKLVGKWMRDKGCPKRILIDRSSIYTSEDFINYVKNELGAKLIHTIPYYPQGNGINESSHKSLEYIIKTISNDETEIYDFEKIVKNAVLIYNNTPHGALGDTPYFFMYGVDCILPNFSEVITSIDSNIRLLFLKDRWLKFKEVEGLNNIKKKIDDGSNLKVGDIISYRLSDYEREKISHTNGCRNYRPIWSLPYRIKEISNGNVIVYPVYYKGKEVQIPISKIGVIDISRDKLYKEKLESILDISEVRDHLKRSKRIRKANPKYFLHVSKIVIIRDTKRKIKENSDNKK